VADPLRRRRWRLRDRSNERLQDEKADMHDAMSALRAGDLDAAEKAILELRMELRNEIRGSDSYVPVFLLTLVLVAAVPLASDHPFVASLLTIVATATVILSLHRSRIRVRWLRIASVVAILAGVSGVIVVYIAANGSHANKLAALSALLFAILLGMTLPAMLRRVLTSSRITINTLAAAITTYLMLGLFFATVYRVTATVQTQQFFAQTATPTGSDYEYFSFITLTTVGYGDLSPASDAARAGAVSEAIIGQVFLVTIVARVVSSLGFQYEAAARAEEAADDDRGPHG
jgi:hypothetical protein